MPDRRQGDGVGRRDLDVGADERPLGAHRGSKPAQLAAAEAGIGGGEIEIDRGGRVEAWERGAHCETANRVVFDGQLRNAAGHPESRPCQRSGQRHVDAPPAGQNDGRRQMAARQAAGRGPEVSRLDPRARLDAPVVDGAMSVHLGARCAGAEVRVQVLTARIDVEIDRGHRHVAHQLGEIEVPHPEGQPRGGRPHLGQIDGALRVDPPTLGHQLEIGPQRLGASVVVDRALEADRSHLDRWRGRACGERAAADRQRAEIDDHVRAARGFPGCLCGLSLRRLRRRQRPRQIRRGRFVIAEHEPQLGASDLQPPDIDVSAEEGPGVEGQIEARHPSHLGPVWIAQHHALEREPVTAEPQPIDRQLSSDARVQLFEGDPPDQLAAAIGLGEGPEATDRQERDRQDNQDCRPGDTEGLQNASPIEICRTQAPSFTGVLGWEPNRPKQLSSTGYELMGWLMVPVFGSVV
jgi:hypothetical protein